MADERKSETIDVGIVRRTSSSSVSYIFTVACGMDPNGKQIRKKTTWKKPDELTIKKADKKAKELYLEFKQKCEGSCTFDENMRFEELVDEYLKLYAPNELKPITAYTYEGQIRNHFLQYFGNKKLKDIKSAGITEFFNSYEVNGHKLSHSTAKKLYTIFQSVFTFAVKQDYIKDSPCKNVILPKADCTKDEKRKFLNEDEFPDFLKMFDENRSDFDRMILFLLYTGLRSGEMLGLSWADIDFNRKQIYVNHTLSDVGGHHFLTTPKTKGSKRIVSMSSFVCDLLTIQRKYQMEMQQLIQYEHPEMVFTSNTGNYKDRSGLNTQFRKHINGTEFEHLTLHCLRHTNATLLLNSGVDIKVVSEHLGHSDISTTANIYADVLESSRKKTAAIIEMKFAK